jgi:putative tryptophan/tyrosine transport system substrate-binding protein
LKRRDAIIGITLLGAGIGGSVCAQTPGRIRRVGVLRPGSSKEASWIQRDPFERGLRELGWKPGADLLIDYRYGEGDAAKLPALGAELVRKGVEVAVVAGGQAASAVRNASANVPIVMAATNDPIAEGLATDLARPGRNVTGIFIHTFEMDGKRLELLKDAFPRIRRVALLANPEAEPKSYQPRIADLRRHAKRLDVDLEVLEITRKEHLSSIQVGLERGRFDAMMVRPEPQLMDLIRHELVEIAAKLKLPAIYAFRFYAEAGGLMSYGENIPGFHHRSASFVSRILNGARAGDLPFERPTKFELTLNLKTAKSLGLEIPKAILFRADEVIQ